MYKHSLRYEFIFCWLVLFLTVSTVQASPLPDGNDPSAHWTLNQEDYDGDYIDTIADYIARPVNEPNFISGVRDEINGAVMIGPSSGWGESQTFAFDVTDGFSICFWADWKGDGEQTVDANDLIVESSESETEYIVTNGLKADERWQHVCVTYDNSNVRIYLNGVLKLSEEGQLSAGSEAVIEVGNSLREQIFNGAVDDIRLYNYPLSQTEITQLVTGEQNCTGEYGLEFDFSGPYGVPDCVVDLYDLEEFTRHWLENCTWGYGQDYDFSGPGGEPDCIVNFYDLAEFCKHWLESGL
jgi:hypothetical protein